MKKLLFLLLLATATVSAQKDVVKFSGKIANKNSDMITISGKDFKKTIPVNKDGSFSASFSVPEGLYQFDDGGEYTTLFLKNGFDLTMTLDAKQFDESIVYKGKGEKENNFLARKTLMEEELEPKLMAVKDDQEAMAKLIRTHSEKIKEAMSAPDMDPGLKAAFDAEEKASMAQREKMQKQMLEQMAAAEQMKGKQSPSFDYENHKGGNTKLADLKGKYVYVDTWATWCGPCRAEIPHLKKVEQKYHGKNIEFVSISIDTKKDYDKWRKFVTDNELGGVQLFADKDWSSQFVVDYKINSIPRFILIDPDGKVVDANAPRPSSAALQEQLDKLLN